MKVIEGRRNPSATRFRHPGFEPDDLFVDPGRLWRVVMVAKGRKSGRSCSVALWSKGNSLVQEEEGENQQDQQQREKDHRWASLVCECGILDELKTTTAEIEPGGQTVLESYTYDENLNLALHTAAPSVL